LGRIIAHLIMTKLDNNACYIVGAPSIEGHLRQLLGCSLRAILILDKCNSMLQQPRSLYIMHKLGNGHEVKA
jgi:hypothetical protein